MYIHTHTPRFPQGQCTYKFMNAYMDIYLYLYLLIFVNTHSRTYHTLYRVCSNVDLCLCIYAAVAGSQSLAIHYNIASLFLGRSGSPADADVSVIGLAALVLVLTTLRGPTEVWTWSVGAGVQS